MVKKMTYLEFINNNKNIEKEAIILLITEKLNIAKWELNLNDDIDEKLIDDLDLLKQNIPVQYILGYTYFYKSKFIVNKNVLIPRFDTEVLVEETLKIIKNYNNPKILDLCTGSGCIGISIKKEMPLLSVTCIDISIQALNVAKMNAKLNNTEITFVQSDLLRNIEDTFDIIVSNPPYIDINEEVMSLVKDNEPSLALYSPNEGLYHYEEIMKQAQNHLSMDGCILFEIPSNKDDKIIKLVLKYFNEYKIIKDNNHLSRVIILKQRRTL